MKRNSKNTQLSQEAIPMNHTTTRSRWLLRAFSGLLAALPLAPEMSRAEPILDYHGAVLVYGSGSQGTWWGEEDTSFYRHENHGVFGGDLAAYLEGGGSGWGNGTQTVYTTASTRYSAAGLIRVAASAAHSGSGGLFSPIHADARAVGAWRDIIYYSGGHLPESLQLTFTIAGTLGATAHNNNGGTATIAAGVRSGVGSVDVSHHLSLSTQASYNEIDGVSHSGFQNVVVTDLEESSVLFQGQLRFNAHYDPSYGGYTFHVSTGVRSFVQNLNWGTAASRFGNSVSLTSVTLPDGTPLSDADIWFDSGMKLLATANAEPIAVASIVIDGEDLGDFAEIPCDGHHGTLVLLDGSGSFDPEGDKLDYEWSVAEDSGILIEDYTAAVTEALFPLGVHEVTLTVYDLDDQGERKGGVDVDSVTIIVFDKTPPVALVTTDLPALWPANNKMVPVVIHVVASDHCTDPDDLLVFCTITSNQPDDSDGSGEHVGDVDGHDGYTAPVEIELDPLGDGEYAALIYLRAERDGDDKDGRVYSINIAAMDTSDNVGHASTTVVVPHNMRTK